MVSSAQEGGQRSLPVCEYGYVRSLSREIRRGMRERGEEADGGSGADDRFQHRSANGHAIALSRRKVCFEGDGKKEGEGSRVHEQPPDWASFSCE